MGGEGPGASGGEEGAQAGGIIYRTGKGERRSKVGIGDIITS